jgi:hypothetical protein
MSFNSSIEGDIIKSVRSQQAQFDELSRELELERRIITKKIEEVNILFSNYKLVKTSGFN